MSDNDKLKSDLCLKCIECCKIMGFYINAKDVEAVQFYDKRGCRLSLVTPEIISVTIDRVCPELSENGCKIYENRPRICKNFDGRLHNETKGICLWNGLE